MVANRFNSGIVDNSLLQNCTLEMSSVLVPDNISLQEAERMAYQLRKNWGNHLEGLGFNVLKMSEHLEPDPRPFLTERGFPGYKRYVLYAWVRRKPVVYHFDIPDSHVEAQQKVGLKLME